MRVAAALFLFVATSTFVFAQTDQQQIDEQVWKPFTKAIMTQDVKGFVALHSKDLVRAERDQKQILNLAEYQKRMEESWPRWKESMKKDKTVYSFELRFLERNSNGNQAYEVGYFKNDLTTPTGEKNVSYGKFQVALRKENGVWKILVDSDSDEGGTITEEMFAAAQPIR